MKTHRILLFAAALALSLPAAGQQAKSAEIQRLEQMLQAAPDHGGVWLEMAAAQARAGNKAEALRWLEKAVSRGLDFDLPDESPDKAAFAQLRETPEMKELLARAAANRRVVNHGRVAFRIPEKDLIPEGIAHDPQTGAYYVGSIHKRKIVRIDKAGKASDFTASGQDGLWDVLGLRVDPAPEQPPATNPRCPPGGRPPTWLRGSRTRGARLPPERNRSVS